MINRQTITDSYLYTLGRWISPTLTNSTAGFPIDITSEWGYLIWEESNTGTGYTGQVRIDLVNPTTNEVLLGDIIKNVDGTPTDISSIGTADIKIIVKNYGLEYPTPIISNVRIKYKNSQQEQVLTNAAKNVLLNRALSTTTTTPIYNVQFGNNQTIPFIETSTDINNAISSAYPIDGNGTIVSLITPNLTENIIESTFQINNGDVIIPNGTTINSLGFKNNDASQIFIGGCRHIDIVKDSNYYYYYKVTFKIYDKKNSLYQFTRGGKNILLDRIFYTAPTYNGIKNGVVGYQTTDLSETMTGLTNTYFGPSAFQYTLLDTTKYRLTTSLLMDQNNGNNFTYNAIGNENDDGTPVFIYAALLDEDIQKTTTYNYQFNTNYNILKPINTLL